MLKKNLPRNPYCIILDIWSSQYGPRFSFQPHLEMRHLETLLAPLPTLVPSPTSHSTFQPQWLQDVVLYLCVFAHAILSASSVLVFFFFFPQPFLACWILSHSSKLGPNATPHVKPSLAPLLPTLPEIQLVHSLCCYQILSIIHHSTCHVLLWIDIYVSIFSANLQATLGHLFLSKVLGIHSVLNK